MQVLRKPDQYQPFAQAVTQSWYRSRQDKVLGGVCMGLAKQFNVSVTLIRLAFLLGTFFGGWGLIIYIAFWFIMPKEPVVSLGEGPVDRGAHGLPPDTA